MPTTDKSRARGKGIMLLGLRREREDAGYALRELGELANVPAATISKLELGHRGAQGRTARALAEALGVSVKDLRRD